MHSFLPGERAPKEISLSLAHDPLSWQNWGNLELMDEAGNLFALDNARVNGPFAVGALYLQGELADEDTPYATVHYRSGIVLGMWSLRASAEVHADTIAPLMDWKFSASSDMPDEIADFLVGLPPRIISALNNGHRPWDPRFPKLEYMN